MKAMQVRNGVLGINETSLPEGAGEALIRVTCSGICNTDLEIVRGYAGFEGTIGHEFVGVVEASDERPDLIGKRVVGEINAGCNHCELCLSGDTRHCPDRTVLGIKGRDGAHAEFLRLPAVNLLTVPGNVTDHEAVFVEPLAAALGISERADMGPDTKVAVIGDGKLGLLCSFAMSTLTKHTSLIGKHTSKMNIAAGYDIGTFEASEITHLNSSYDIVIEASGSESGFASALDLVRPRGTIVLKSTFSGKPVWEAWRVVVDEISVIGSRCGRFEPAIRLLESKRFDLTSLISEEFAFGNALAGMEKAASKGVLKVLLNMQN